MYTFHNLCRACGVAQPDYIKADRSSQLVPVLDLGLQPLANDFKNGQEWHAGWYPLKVLVCPKCSLAQLSVVVDPRTLYSSYSYVTSHSKTMQAHFESIRADILKDATCANSVLEIGSNDGTLLAFLKNNPFETVLGCDPAENLASIANQNGVPTFCGLFTYENCDCKLPKDVVIARHVMCHIDDWHDFVRGLERVTHKESLVAIEVPYYRDMIRTRSWDQVYAEHLSYMSIRAIDALVKNSDFHIHKVIHYPIHGGSVMIYLRRNESTVPRDATVQEWIDGESVFLEEWKTLADSKDVMVDSLKSMVSDLKAQGKTVAGYGASAKSTVWIAACGFTNKDIDFICDNTPQKLGKLCPGTTIPIVDEGTFTRELPQYAVCFAWNFFKPEIYEKEVTFRGKGGKWILPVPSVQVV